MDCTPAAAPHFGVAAPVAHAFAYGVAAVPGRQGSPTTRVALAACAFAAARS